MLDADKQSAFSIPQSAFPSMDRASAHHRLSARQRRRLRLRRHGRRAYIRSVYSLPSLATLGNAICGFGAMYVCTLDPDTITADPVTTWFLAYRFVAAAYLIFCAMLFDALDGRLARMARHTTDFGGQLDSLADVISFGAAPAFLALQVFKDSVLAHDPGFPTIVSRLIWAAGAMYMACAAIRLARFNVSNEHGEQHHFSFLGLPSPGAGAVVASLVLMQQDLDLLSHGGTSPGLFHALSLICLWAMPVILLGAGLLMVSNIRYPHLVNRYLRGKRSLGQLLFALALLLGLVVAHRYVLGLGTLIYTIGALVGHAMHRFRIKPSRPDAPAPVLSDSPRTT
jgi:CDP-diacylglycerol--serine O-phosphatidyltransferase